MVKITDKIISIPPYISTTWDKVVSLHMKEQELIITLKNGEAVALPGLAPDVIELMFSSHAAFLEASASRPIQEPVKKILQGADHLGAPFRLAFGSIETIGQSLQHNPAYSDLPPIPADIAEKIGLIAKAVPSEDLASLPAAEENCNCIYCQMCRILKQGVAASAEPLHMSVEPLEEEVSEADLRFEQWEITNSGDKLYHLTNKLDSSEQYDVFLGSPVGCTCGKPNCEHVIAVLRH
ncbi:MAG: hypothetical protein JSR46_10810 [Verrucomicrobia bacterium]|nr:hypothetical protein [Verrucomicrobiota bacterium]